MIGPTNQPIAKLKRIAVARRPGEIWDIGGGQKLGGIHFKEDCLTAHCVIHNPGHHHMSTWPLNYRLDRNIFERICEHRIGHPDPDQFEYWDSIGKESEGIHGCDGCCHTGELHDAS